MSVSALAAYLPYDRVMQLLDPTQPTAADGVALIADISGFTAFTELLANHLRDDQGAESLTRTLEGVFTPLVQAIDQYQGSVLKYGGDALIVWYPRARATSRRRCILRALASAHAMQAVMEAHGTSQTPIGTITLRMKIGLVYGSITRFVVGTADYGLEDAAFGSTLERMAAAEHHATAGQIVTDETTAALVQDAVIHGQQHGEFVVVEGLRQPPPPHPWPRLHWSPAEHDQIAIRLSAFVPAPIAAALLDGRAVHAELKPVVSLFVQFHGIQVERNRQAFDQIQHYFTTAQAIVAHYAGRVNRLITGDKGNTLHILFGAPLAVEEQETRAFHCALDLQAAAAQLPFIQTQRIGIARGRVYAGPVGASTRHDYTVMGDAINRSARLMQHAAPGTILTETALMQYASAGFVYGEAWQLPVKGKTEPLSVVTLAAYADTIQPGPPVVLYGRQAETALLAQAITQLETRQGGVVVLTGELGLGKTMLLVDQQSQCPSAIRWLGAICPGYGQPISGSVWIGLLRMLLDQLPTASEDNSHSRLMQVCAACYGVERIEASYPYLARFLGLSLTPEQNQRLAGLAGESLRWQVFSLLRELFMQIAATRPVVLAIDDLQWSDPTSLELIRSIAPLVQSHAILLILSMRPEYATSAWQLCQEILASQHNTTRIDLQPFDTVTAIGFVQRLIPGAPDRFCQELAVRTGGNPLFLVELIRTLHGQPGFAQPERLEPQLLTALRLPDTIQGLLVAQIDRLVPSTSQVLQSAAVIGPVFLDTLLARLLHDERQLGTHLAQLAEQQFILPERLPHTNYRFRHMLIQQSAYGMLLYERRRQYHRQIAELIEHAAADRRLEQATILAYHYEQAGAWSHAITYLIQAADNARLLAAHQEAIHLYQHALALLDSVPAAHQYEQRIAIALKLAQVHAHQEDFRGAQGWYETAFALREHQDYQHDQQPDPGTPIQLGVFEHGPTTLDPGTIVVSDQSEIVRDLYEGLIELDSDLTVVPAAARRWSVSDDGRVYRFELRPGMRWSDGTPLTAADFVAAWQRNLHPNTPAGAVSILFLVEQAEAYHTGQLADPSQLGIHARDPLTLEIRLVRPVGHFLYMLDEPVTYPQPRHQLERYQSAAFAPDKLVCNGAFRIAAWQAGQQIVLERNPFYNGFIPGSLSRITLRFQSPDLNAYLANQIDLCRIEDQTDMTTQQANKPLLVQHLTTYLLAFACGQPALQHAALRRCFGQAINRDDLVSRVWGNLQKAAHGGIVPPGMVGHTPEINLAHDAQAAQQLPPDMLPPTICLATPRGAGTLPAYLQETWQQQFGIVVELIQDATIDQIFAGFADGSIQVALLGVNADYPDPGCLLYDLFCSASPQHFSGWQHDGYDQLVVAASRTVGLEQRLALYHQAERILIQEEAVVVPLYYYQSYLVLRPPLQLQGGAAILRTGNLRLKQLTTV